jgi:enoyl-CoA hydratase/carnithine racemase
VTDKVLVDVRDGAAWITINRPERRNALDAEANTMLYDALRAADADPRVKAVILTGAGDQAFCAGADVTGVGGVSTTGGRASFGGLTGVGGAWHRPAKPTMAVVRGWAVGGGFELAAACDIVLAADNARFSLPEAAMGVLGDSLVVHRAVRHLPHHVAMDLILTGRVMDAAEATALGFVSAMASLDELPQLLEDRLGRLLASAPGAVRVSKAVALEGLDLTLDEAVSRGYEAVESYVRGEEFGEAVAALREHRDPSWRSGS